jgi:hypothetical protein
MDYEFCYMIVPLERHRRTISCWYNKDTRYW